MQIGQRFIAFLKKKFGRAQAIEQKAKAPTFDRIRKGIPLGAVVGGQQSAFERSLRKLERAFSKRRPYSRPPITERQRKKALAISRRPAKPVPQASRLTNPKRAEKSRARWV